MATGSKTEISGWKGTVRECCSSHAGQKQNKLESVPDRKVSVTRYSIQYDPFITHPGTPRSVLPITQVASITIKLTIKPNHYNGLSLKEANPCMILFICQTFGSVVSAFHPELALVLGGSFS